MFHNATVKPFNKEQRNFTIRRREGNENAKNNKKGVLGKTTTLHMRLTFVYISLPFLHYYDQKLPSFTF